MKLFKKVGAVFLALAMIAVMIPQLESKVVKAAAPSQTETWTYKDNTTNEGTIIKPYVTSSFKVTNTKKILDPDDNSTYGQALKTGSSSYFNIVVPDGKFAKVTVVAVSNSSGRAGCIALGSNVSDAIELYNEDNTVAKKITMTGYLSGGTTKLTHSKNQILILKIIVDVYDRDTDVPSDAEVTKVKVSGTVTSSISLVGGKISFGLEETDLTLKEGTTDQYTYEFAEIKGDGAEHTVEIIAPEVTKGLKNIDPTSFGANGKVQVEGAEDKVFDFTLNYTPLDGLTWDFTDTSQNWQRSSYEGKIVTYKGLGIDATANSTSPKYSAKFDVQGNRVQINEATKVTIPVSGWGKVTCTFSGAVKSSTKLGEQAGDNTAKTISYDYKNAESVELSIGTDNDKLYLEKIVVEPDKTQPVTLLGTAVRQETAGWGNGIRFGATLDLTKVDKTTCTSGTLIGLESIVGADKEMTMDDVGKTCLDVVRTTFIKEENNQLEYAAALINIPEEQKNTKIVARSYVKVGDNVYYGEQQTATWNGVAAAVQ